MAEHPDCRHANRVNVERLVQFVGISRIIPKCHTCANENRGKVQIVMVCAHCLACGCGSHMIEHATRVHGAPVFGIHPIAIDLLDFSSYCFVCRIRTRVPTGSVAPVVELVRGLMSVGTTISARDDGTAKDEPMMRPKKITALELLRRARGLPAAAPPTPVAPAPIPSAPAPVSETQPPTPITAPVLPPPPVPQAPVVVSRPQVPASEPMGAVPQVTPAVNVLVPRRRIVPVLVQQQPQPQPPPQKPQQPAVTPVPIPAVPSASSTASTTTPVARQGKPAAPMDVGADEKATPPSREMDIGRVLFEKYAKGMRDPQSRLRISPLAVRPHRGDYEPSDMAIEGAIDDRNPMTTRGPGGIAVPLYDISDLGIPGEYSKGKTDDLVALTETLYRLIGDTSAGRPTRVMFVCGTRRSRTVGDTPSVPAGIDIDPSGVVVCDHGSVEPRDVDDTLFVWAELARLTDAILITTDTSGAYPCATWNSGAVGGESPVLELFGRVTKYQCVACRRTYVARGNVVSKSPPGSEKRGILVGRVPGDSGGGGGSASPEEPPLSLGPAVHRVEGLECEDCRRAGRGSGIIVDSVAYHGERTFLPDVLETAAAGVAIVVDTALDDRTSRALARSATKVFYIGREVPDAAAGALAYESGERLRTYDGRRIIQPGSRVAALFMSHEFGILDRLPDPWKYAEGAKRDDSAFGPAKYEEFRKAVSDLASRAPAVSSRKIGPKRREPSEEEEEEEADEDFVPGEESEELGEEEMEMSGEEREEAYESDFVDEESMAIESPKGVNIEPGPDVDVDTRPAEIAAAAEAYRKTELERTGIDPISKPGARGIVSTVGTSLEAAAAAASAAAATPRKRISPTSTSQAPVSGIAGAGPKRASADLASTLLGISGWAVAHGAPKAKSLGVTRPHDAEPPAPDDKLAEAVVSLAKFLRAAKAAHGRVLVVTGSRLGEGIPGFDAGLIDPDTGLQRSDAQRALPYPTAAHSAIRSLVLAGYVSDVVTTNIDGLHSLVGTPATAVHELFGNAFVEECDNIACGRRVFRRRAVAASAARDHPDATTAAGFRSAMETARRISLVAPRASASFAHYSVVIRAQALLPTDLASAVAGFSEISDAIRDYAHLVPRYGGSIAEPVTAHRIVRMLVSTFAVLAGAFPPAMVDLHRATGDALMRLVDGGLMPPGVAYEPADVSVCDISFVPIGSRAAKVEGFSNASASPLEAIGRIVSSLAGAKLVSAPDRDTLESMQRELVAWFSARREASKLPESLVGSTLRMDQLKEAINRLELLEDAKAQLAVCDEKIRNLGPDLLVALDAVASKTDRFTMPDPVDVASAISTHREEMLRAVPDIVAEYEASVESDAKELEEARAKRREARHAHSRAKAAVEAASGHQKERAAELEKAAEAAKDEAKRRVTEIKERTKVDEREAKEARAFAEELRKDPTAKNPMLRDAMQYAVEWALRRFRASILVDVLTNGVPTVTMKIDGRNTEISLAPIYIWDGAEANIKPSPKGIASMSLEQLDAAVAELEEEEEESSEESDMPNIQYVRPAVRERASIRSGLRHEHMYETIHDDADPEAIFGESHWVPGGLCDACGCTTHDVLVRFADEPTRCVQAIGTTFASMRAKMAVGPVKRFSGAIVLGSDLNLDPLAKEMAGILAGPRETREARSGEATPKRPKPFEKPFSVICNPRSTDSDDKFGIGVRCAPGLFVAALAEVLGIRVPEFYATEMENSVAAHPPRPIYGTPPATSTEMT